MAKKLFRNPQAILGLALILIVLLAALLSPLLAPHDPNATDLTKRYLAPCPEYPLGADELGRCELSRLLYGARASLGISFPVLLILAVLGLFLGALSACGGRVPDQILTFVCDTFISFPQLVIAIAVIGILGTGVRSVILAIVVAMWAWFARMVRSYAALEMGKDYILAARLSGCGTGKLIVLHLIPNILPQFLVYLSTGVASSILMVSGFAFLGLGLPPETAEWGGMLSSARGMIYTHPEMLVYPGVCILIAAAGFNLFGEALRDVLEGEG